MKTVLVEYVLSEGASIEDLEREISAFVSGIRELGLGIRYASHRKQGLPRAYVHVGVIPTESALAALQAAPFFERFGKALRPVCAEAPRVTWLEVVASTES